MLFTRNKTVTENSEIPFGILRYLLRQSGKAHYHAGEVLLRPGQPVIQAWYIYSGRAKHYFMDEDGLPHIDAFYGPGSLITLEEEFLGGKRSGSYISLLEDCCLVSISYQQLQYLLYHYPATRPLLVALLLEALKLARYHRKLLSYPGAKRYALFVKMFPAAHFPVKDIASFLNLSPGSLSRIRSKL